LLLQQTCPSAPVTHSLLPVTLGRPLPMIMVLCLVVYQLPQIASTLSTIIAPLSHGCALKCSVSRQRSPSEPKLSKYTSWGTHNRYVACLIFPRARWCSSAKLQISTGMPFSSTHRSRRNLISNFWATIGYESSLLKNEYMSTYFDISFYPSHLQGLKQLKGLCHKFIID
jgi:hypothetical protein